MSKFIEVNEFIDIVGGEMDMLGPIEDGDTIYSIVPPGCWGPMITPSIRSGHEVTRPIKVKGAKVGDAVALHIKKINLKSKYAASGTGKRFDGRYDVDPTVNAICPYCNEKNPETIIEGIGEESIRCSKCKNPIIPQALSNGYTILFNEDIGVTVDKTIGNEIALEVAKGNYGLPSGSKQHPATILAKADVVDVITRVKPMIGNIGCIPSKPLPSSRNCGDMLTSLNSTNIFGQILHEDITDAHMDINSVCEGSIVICPVKVDGGGVFFGDIHSIQGDGELAMHAIDVTAEVEIEVRLIKELELKGPIIVPPLEEVNYRFLPFTEKEYEKANKILETYGQEIKERLYPVQFVGSGSNLNLAIDNCVNRISEVTGYDMEEVKNRATISGEVGIGRTSGLAYITIMLPEEKLKKIKIYSFIEKIYK